MPFRFQGRYLFLTYSQCNVSADTLIQHIRAQREPEFILVGLEQHADGGEHRHIFVDFGRRFSFTNERRFDVSGHHPNIARPRSPKDCLAYCAKDGNTTTYGTLPSHLDEDVKESRNQLWGRLLDEATSRESFLSAVRAVDPFVFATRYQALAAMAAEVFKPADTYENLYEPQDFRLPAGIEEWMVEQFDQEVSFFFLGRWGLFAPNTPNPSRGGLCEACSREGQSNSTTWL